MEKVRDVACAGGTIEYRLERKPVKNLNLRVRWDGSVYVSANKRVPLHVIDEFVAKQAGFVARTREKLAKAAQKPEPMRYVSGECFCLLGEKLVVELAAAAPDGGEEVVPAAGKIRLVVRDTADQARRERVFDRWLRRRATAVFGEVLAEIYPLVRRLGVAYPELRIRRMKARWGSCMSGRGIITLNTRLLAAPRECVEYVVLHELCHFVHPNHSRDFYGLLGELMPDWRQRKDMLKQY